VTLTEWGNGGVYYWDLNSSRIENITAKNNHMGLALYGTNFTIVNNNASDNYINYQISTRYTNVNHNRAIGGGTGIAMMGGTMWDNTISDNIISDFSNMGITLGDARNNTFVTIILLLTDHWEEFTYIHRQHKGIL